MTPEEALAFHSLVFVLEAEQSKFLGWNRLGVGSIENELPILVTEASL